MNFYPFNDIETISPRPCCSSRVTLLPFDKLTTFLGKHLVSAGA